MKNVAVAATAVLLPIVSASSRS